MSQGLRVWHFVQTRGAVVEDVFDVGPVAIQILQRLVGLQQPIGHGSLSAIVRARAYFRAFLVRGGDVAVVGISKHTPIKGEFHVDYPRPRPESAIRFEDWGGEETPRTQQPINIVFLGHGINGIAGGLAGQAVLPFSPSNGGVGTYDLPVFAWHVGRNGIRNVAIAWIVLDVIQTQR